MKIRILNWSSKGFRCPDYEVNLENDGGPYHISLLQMPNGTGKTTTLELLRATLTGEAASWNEKTISELKRNEDKVERGEFICTLLYDSKRVTFELDANFEQSNIEYRTTTDKGINEGHHPPRELLPYLTSDFLELFIFDG